MPDQKEPRETRDDLGRVLCCHGRPMLCAECGADYAAEVNAAPDVRPAVDTIAGILWAKCTEIGGGRCYLRTNLDDLAQEIATAIASAPSRREPLSLHRCKICGTLWLLWPAGVGGTVDASWNLLDKYSMPGACCDNVAMGDQIEHLRDLPLEVASRREPSDLAAWQPIVTAPKDGTKLILFQRKYGPVIGRWLMASAAAPCWWVTNGGWRAEPTHWMPLPDPPPAAVLALLDTPEGQP